MVPITVKTSNWNQALSEKSVSAVVRRPSKAVEVALPCVMDGLGRPSYGFSDMDGLGRPSYGFSDMDGLGRPSYGFSDKAYLTPDKSFRGD